MSDGLMGEFAKSKIEEIKKINDEKKQTIVIVTHSSELAELTKDKYKIEKGSLKKI